MIVKISLIVKFVIFVKLEFQFCQGHKVKETHWILTEVAILTVQRCSDKESSVTVTVTLLVFIKTNLPFIIFKIGLHKCFLCDFILFVTMSCKQKEHTTNWMQNYWEIISGVWGCTKTSILSFILLTSGQFV